MNVEIGSSRNVGATPPFLTKTFQIVNDANTNSIVSWAQNGDSFIIWDHIKFSAQILPNYFRHNNFSSFVYQLNNYGFRKIGVEYQWEYSNPYFQQGKPDLLPNMKRRSEQNNPTPPRQKNSLNPDILRKCIEESRREMKKLKQQKSDMELKMVELRQTANNLEATTKKLIVQWAKACEMMVKVEEEDAAEPLVLPSPADDESKSAATLRVEDYSVELDNMDKRDQVYEVEAPNQHAIAIAQDFQVWLTEINALW